MIVHEAIRKRCFMAEAGVEGLVSLSYSGTLYLVWMEIKPRQGLMTTR